METKVQKWGNSLGVRIPRAIASSARLRAGTSVEILAEGDSIVIRAANRPRYRLADLLKAVTRRNLQAAVDTGAPVGREAL